MLNFFRKPKAPYFIWAPAWDDNSSGVRALHMLCHALNESGYKAYLIPVNQIYWINHGLNTRILTEDIVHWYNLRNLAPVVVYPDIVQGNPMKAKKVVRWLLAPAGKYGGDESFAPEDKVYGYTADLAGPVLCLPTFDTTVYYPPSRDAERKGACFYSHKYDKIHGNKLLPLTKGMTRCEGPPEKVAEILRTHEECYIYERSEIAVNARLCGCAVKFVVTDYFDGSMPEELNLSQHVLQNRFEKQLVEFIRDTQTWL